MKIIDILKSGKVTVSCELFPPKAGAELEGAKQVVRRMAELKPSFMSVDVYKRQAIPVDLR